MSGDVTCYDPRCGWAHGHCTPWVAHGPGVTEPMTEEFRDKQRELAGYLFRIAYGGTMRIDQVAADPAYGQEYADNYLADADSLLRSSPHLLSPDTLEVMRLPRQQLVWVGTVTSELQPYGQPAVYVSDTEDGLFALVALQNGVPADVSKFDLSDWFQGQGMVFDSNSHYVE